MHDLYRVVVPSILIGTLMVLVGHLRYALVLGDVVGASLRRLTGSAPILFHDVIIRRLVAATTRVGVDGHKKVHPAGDNKRLRTGLV